MAKKSSKLTKKQIAAERERKRIVAQKIRARKKAERLALLSGSVAETSQSVAPVETVQESVSIATTVEAPIIPAVEPKQIESPPTIKAPTSFQKNNYAEAIAYGKTEQEAERLSGLSKAIADQLEANDDQFIDAQGNTVSFCGLMEEARASAKSGLDLFIERALRQRAANGDRSAIEQLQERQRKSEPPPPPKVETIEEKLQRLREKDLELIEKKQANGDTLTESDRKIIREMKMELAEKSTASKVRDTIKLSIEKKLVLAKETAFDVAYDLLQSSKREDVRMNAASFLKQWADNEEPPQEPYVLELAKPQNEKIVNIKTA